jgi:DtxR family Mn-dependent transcriptional regulator
VDVSPAVAADALTRSVEDYLKAVYRLSSEERAASTTEIAQRLALSPASVSAMVKRLADQGLLEHERYRGVRLTDDGRRAALRIVRRHRLVETYLVEFLGYDWDNVHAEAELLEHAMSDELVERMAAALGHPAFDPHGDPIPAADGSISPLEGVPLTTLVPGDQCILVRVSEADSERLRYLASLGIRPGLRFTVVDRAPFDGPVTLQTSVGTRVIGHALAGGLLCVRESTA